MEAMISSTMMCLGMSSSRRSRTASFRSSPLNCSSSSWRTVKRTFSVTPHSAGSKSTKLAISTMWLPKTRTWTPSTSTTASLTPLASSSMAFSRVSTSPGSARISPVMGSTTGRASFCPDRRGPMASFLLNL